jgi:tRNA (guanine37-N1)-methyltransferase
VWFGVVTLFPEMFHALDYGITGRALKQALIKVTYWNPRDFTKNKYKRVDDRPYGGGCGMLMQAQPLQEAIIAAKQAAPKNTKPHVVYLSPQGSCFNQATAEKSIKQKESMILIAGRYEGIDERLLTTEVDEEWSIGDYIVSGGELPAMMVIDAITRLLPNALGDDSSAIEDSISSGLLKYPQYTRPEVFADKRVPEVLLQGDHQAIEYWRLRQSLEKTKLRRSDLLKKYVLEKLELETDPKLRKLLMEFIEEEKK